MKRILTLSVLFALLFVGCQDEQMAENKPANTTRSVEIVAEIDDESYSRTHTERDESDTRNLYIWDKADLLSVFMGDATEVSCFKIAKLSDDGRTAAFRGDVIIWGGAEDDGISHLPNVAFYPYGDNLKSVSYKKEDASFSLTANLPGTQMWGGSGTFATNTAPMIAVTEDASSYSFFFKAIAAVSQLHLKAAEGLDGTKIVKAVMKVDGYPMAGTYTVTSTFDGVKSVVAAEDAVSSVSMENTDGVELDTENKVIFTFVHFPLPAEDKVVTFELYDAEGNYMTHVLNSNKAFTAKDFMHAGRTNPIVYNPTGSIAQDLLDALEAAKSGDVVDFTLPIDITLEEQLYVKGGVTLNLDLNGYTITSEVTDKSAVKIDRLSGVLNAKNGTIKNVAGSNSETSSALIELNDADGKYLSKLTLDGVTLEQNQVGSNNVSYAISYSSTADLELTNVTMNAVDYGIKSSGQAAPTGGGLVINSGTYIAAKNVLAQGTNGTIFGTINGGYFKSTNSQCIGISTKGTGTEIVFRSGYFSDNKYQYAEWEESGNAEYPYTVANTGYSYNETTKQGEIWSAKGMKAFYAALIGGKNFAGGTLKLTASIDMAGFEWDSNSESGSTKFAGTFDGGNNTITNLTLVASKAGGYATLFSLFSGEVKDLTIDGVTATDNTNGGRASAVAGYTAGGKLSGVTVKNLTAVGMQKVAGLVSNFPEYGELTIEDCHVEKVTLKPNGQGEPLWQAGGILGYATSFKKLVVENSSVSNITLEDAATKADCADMPYYCHPFIGNLDNNNAEGKNSEAILNNNKVEYSTVTDVHGECSSDYYAFGKARNTSKLTITIDGVYYVGKAADLAAVLTSDVSEINVVLTGDIDLPISSLGQQTGGSGEYKLGGTSTEKINIDLNEKKLNITTTYWSAIGAKNDNATFTIKNGTMTSSQATGTWNSYDVTFANCNYVIEDVDFLKSIAFTNAGKQVSLTNVDINETHDYYAIWITAEGQTVNIDGGNITSGGRGIKIDEQYVDAASKVKLSVSNYGFTTANKAAILVKSVAGADITLSNIDISNVAADTEYAVWCDEDAALYADLITVTGGKMWIEGTTPIADGVLLNAKGEYEISKKAGLLWLANQVNADNRLTDKTVKLTADIDLNNENWTPIGNAAGTNYSHNFEGTFDGNGKTISNLTVSNAKCAGFFGKMCKGTIKNLTVNGATLTTNHYAGAIVAWMEQGGGAFTMENCHVKNATIKVTPDMQSDGNYDNGDKAGALVGFMYVGTINNCSAENVDITAYRDLGGIVGYVKNSTVTNNTVTGAKLTVDQKTNYYGDKVVNVGQIIGRRDGTPNESGNSHSNVTIDTVTAQDGDFNKTVKGGDL